MKLSDSGKNMICRSYDEFLSKFMPVSTLLHGKCSPGLVYWDNYDDDTREEHLKNVFDNTQAIITKYPILQSNDVIEFIHNPDFEVKTDIMNDKLFKGCNSLENALIYRFLYEQVVVEPVQKRPCDDFQFGEKVRPLTKITLLKISNSILYYKEDIFFVNDEVYNSIARYFMIEESNRRYVPLTEVPIDQKLLINVWNQFDKMNYEHYRCIKPVVVYKSKEFHDMFTSNHTKDFNDDDFVFIEKMPLDNRKSVGDKENKGERQVLSLARQRLF